MRTILITGDFDLPAHLDLRHAAHLRAPRNEDDLIAHLQTARHYIVGGPEYVGDKILSFAPCLKHIVVLGTGTSSFVDLDAARARAIEVDNTPGINAAAVAEFALGAIITNLANCHHSYSDLLAGGWYQQPHQTLTDSSVGIVGFGNIGSRLAMNIRALSQTVIRYFSRSRRHDLEAKYNFSFCGLADLASLSDVLVLCVAYSGATDRLIDGRILGLMKPGSILVNFSNPLVVDPDSLHYHLVNGRIGRCYFDGYYQEWAANGGVAHDRHNLLRLGPARFVATSHIAAQSAGAIASMLEVAIYKIEQWRGS